MGVSNFREYEETQVKQHRAAVQEKFEMQRQIGRLEASLGRETHHVSDVEAQVGTHAVGELHEAALDR